MASEQMILKGVEFNPEEDVKYSAIKVNAVGGKSVGILNSTTNKAVYLDTPLMLTWGLNEYTDEKTGKVTYDMSLQFPSAGYPNEDAEAFLESMKTFEQKIKDDALKNSKEWFGKAKMSAEVLDALFTPMLKYPKDKDTGEPDYDRAPTLRVKIPYWEGEWKTEIYDLDQQPLFPDASSSVTPKDLITKGSNVAVLLLCGGIWFANGKFGVTWKLQQAALKPKHSMKGKCFLNISAADRERASRQKNDDDDEEEEAINTQVSDDEDDEIEAEVAEVVQPKKVVKKKVVKKKASE
tara:strand:- start:2997 stop:3878 length:882 start_codon:yes stop_codon:yes gene_type:complete